jgi:hypothetical protein
VYFPGLLKTLTGLIAVDFVPSPKSHKAPPGAGLLVFVKVTEAPSQLEAGNVKSAFTVPIVTKLFFVIVSEQPCELVTINFTGKLPEVL